MIEPRPEIAGTEPDPHGGPLGSRDAALPVRVDFSTSVNAWGPAPAVAEAIARAPLERYPDPESLAARRLAAERWNRPLEEVIFGAGAAELIHATAFAFLRPSDRVLVSTPTFGEYARASRLCGAHVLEVGARPPGWRVDDDALAERIGRERPRLVWCCAPNNPTGEAVGADAIAAIAEACARSGALLVLDQSYDAFAAQPLGTPALPGHPAVLHLRSLTKDHAIPGVRAGFALGPRPVVRAVDRGRPPWSASAAAQAAAMAALSDAGELHLRRTVPRLRAEAARIAAAIRRIGLAPVPSDTHSLLLRVGDAAALERALRREHFIGVRDCTSFGLPEYIRIAARTPRENDLLLAALETLCSS